MIGINRFKEILILSGKGGSGKTFIASSFIHLAGPCIACDYDVDASNLPLLFSAAPQEKQEYSGGQIAMIDRETCLGCGICEHYCQFEAIKDNVVSPYDCEGCALCTHICPVNAVTMQPRSSGCWFKFRRAEGWPLFYAELRPGEENSGKLVSTLKDQARQEAINGEYYLTISDGPPGLACAVIAALNGVDLVVMVAEPSVSGISDITRLHELLKNRSAPILLLVNKYDLYPEGTAKLEDWAKQQGIPLLGRIPYLTAVFKAISQGLCPVLLTEVSELLEPIWENISTLLLQEERRIL
ncbi:MAG: 4Fe-4S binding protein [Syntrophomonas sp.]